MRKAYVLSIGMTKFAKRPETIMEKIGAEAVIEALDDANIDIEQIKAVYCGHDLQGAGAGQRIILKISVPVDLVHSERHITLLLLRDMIFVWLLVSKK